MADDGLLRSLGREADLGGRLALLGCDGYCVFVHSVNGVECAREVWAARCAPFFHPDSEEANCSTNREAFNSFIGDGFQVPELEGESEASKDEQAGSSSENNVGNGALFVIGLQGSGDVIILKPTTCSTWAATTDVLWQHS